jgi:hypothetical protein
MPKLKKRDDLVKVYRKQCTEKASKNIRELRVLAKKVEYIQKALQEGNVSVKTINIWIKQVEDTLKYCQ